VVFSEEEKIEFCSMLAEMGIGQVQLHSNRDAPTIKKIRAKVPGIRVDALVTGIAKNWKDQIKMAVEAGADTVSIVYRASEQMLRYSLEQSFEEMVERVAERIAFARECRANAIRFAPSDATRTEIDKLLKVVKVAIKEGANNISLADTGGVIRPGAYKWLFSQVRRNIDDTIVLCAHCHNDFGLALANSFSALEAGAQVIDVGVNGLGERADGPAVDEFLIGLWGLYGIDLGVKLKDLIKVSEWMAKVSGVDIPVAKPITGTNAFLQKIDVHVAAARKAPFLFEPFDPEIIGRERTLRYGVGSGPVALEEMLKRIGMDPAKVNMQELQKKLDQEVRTTKRSMSENEVKIFAPQYVQR